MALTFDNALEVVGSFGHWQKRVILIASIFYIPNAFALLLLIFACTDPIRGRSWRCLDPYDSDCSAVWHASDPKDSFCELPSSSWAWVNTDSVVAQFNLVCADTWKTQLLNSFMFGGAFFGAGCFGWLADRYGRKLPLFAATSLTSAVMFATCATPNYAYLAVMRALTGFAAAGQCQLFLISTEATGPKHRAAAGIITSVVFTVGEFLLCAVAYALPNWRHLVLAGAAVNAAALLLWPLVPESPRWLLSQGRVEEATNILCSIAASNGSCMPTEPLVCSHSSKSSCDQEQGKSACSTKVVIVECSPETDVDPAHDNSTAGTAKAAQAAQQVSMLQMLKVPTLAMMFLVLVVAWFGQFIGYYGIAMGSGSLPGSIYVSFTLGTAAELVATLVAGVLLDRVGRHNLVAASLVVGGVACLACANIKGKTEVAVLAAVGKFGISAALAACPIYTTELFPTVVRGTALGLLNQVGRCGALAAPFMLMMGSQLALKSAVFLPFMVFGTMAAAAGVLVMFLPETLGISMPETMEDLYQLQTIWSVKPWTQGCLATIKFMFSTRSGTKTDTLDNNTH